MQHGKPVILWNQLQVETCRPNFRGTVFEGSPTIPLGIFNQRPKGKDQLRRASHWVRKRSPFSVYQFSVRTLTAQPVPARIKSRQQGEREFLLQQRGASS